MKDKIDELFTSVDDLTNDTLRSDSGIRITEEGFPIFHIKYSRSVTNVTLTRDELALAIEQMIRALWDMDNWTRRRR